MPPAQTPTLSLSGYSAMPNSFFVEKIDTRTRLLEQRIDQVEADRLAAEYRIHSDTERMLDGLLQEVRAIADLLTGQH